MDGLSAAASVIAVVQMAQAVGGALMEYYEAVKGAREDIQRLYHSIKNLECVLGAIDDLPNTLSTNIQTILEDKTGTLSLCRAELNDIKRGLDTFTTQQKHIGKLKCLIWPFKKKDVDKHVDLIDKHKNDLVLAFGVENLHTSFRNHDILEDIRTEIRAAQRNAEREQIIRWLAASLPDPSTEHNIAREKFQTGTGYWLIEGDRLKTWSETTNSFLWLNGGGNSTVIEHIQQLCEKEPNVIVSYWYITYNNTATQNVSNIIRSWIRDICSNRRDTPQPLKDAYVRCNHGQQQPTTKQIMEMLRCVMVGFRDVYLVVDALDEYPKLERESLLETIVEIRRWEIESTHIFVTSRAEDDIRYHLVSLCSRYNSETFQNIKVEDPNITEDIKKFLKSTIRGFRSRIWNSDLKEEVIDSIAQQADGMFRLAALQLDSLKSLRTASKIREALNQLPHSLDMFYERALKEIPKSDQDYVKIAFQWIACIVRPISVLELSEAVVLQTQTPPYLKENERLNCKGNYDLLDMIPSAFVTTYNNPYASDGDSDSDFDNDSSTNQESQEIGIPENDNNNSSNDDHALGPSGGTLGRQSHTSSNSGEDDPWTDEQLYIRFAHFSVKEYLQSDRTSHGPVKEYHLLEVDCLAIIAERCIAYLLHVGPILKPLLGMASDTESIRPSIADDHLVRFPLSYYAAYCWTYYVQRLESSSCGSHSRVDHVHVLATLLLDDQNPAWEVSQSFIHHFEESAEYLAGKNQSLLRYDDAYMENPLAWACFYGLVSLVPALLNNLKRDVNQQHLPKFGPLGSPLHAVAMSDVPSERIVELLLAAGMDPNSRGGEYNYPLIAAVGNNHLKICRLLVNAGADLEVQNSLEGTALDYACELCSLDMCKYLLVAGANVEGQGGYWTPLQHASAKGATEICRLLLNYGADVNHKVIDLGGRTWTPLITAFQFGFGGDDISPTCSILLEAGADVQASVGPCWDGGPMVSPIVVCLEREAAGFEEKQKTKILNMLLDAGAGKGLGGVKLLSILKERKNIVDEELQAGYDYVYNRVLEQQNEECKKTAMEVLVEDTEEEHQNTEGEAVVYGELNDRISDLSL
ncbi:hypothetical protein NHQ30_000612 [Ciborinia camelliae]|nr:hypothetical protein NHQ30_000612 [Ciborinia camelliae]